MVVAAAAATVGVGEEEEAVPKRRSISAGISVVPLLLLRFPLSHDPPGLTTHI